MSSINNTTTLKCDDIFIINSLNLPQLTTLQRNNISKQFGTVIFNITTNNIEMYSNNGWNILTTSDLLNNYYSKSESDTKYLNKTQNDTMIGTLTISNIDNSGNTLNLGQYSNKIDIGCSSNLQTVNIGSDSTSGNTTINIGGSGDTVNISGTLNYIHSTDLKVSDKTVQLNAESAGSGTARAAGFYIRDSSVDDKGYIVTSNTGDSFTLKAPENSFILSTPTLTQNETIATVSQINTKASTSYVDSQDNLRLLKSGDTMTGNLGVVGKIGINMTPEYDLDVNSSIRATTYYIGTSNRYITVDAIGNTKFDMLGGYLFNTYLNGTTTNITALSILDSGNVGIGTTNPSYTLDVSGTLNTYGNITSSGTQMIMNNGGNNAAYYLGSSNYGIYRPSGTSDVYIKTTSGAIYNYLDSTHYTKTTNDNGHTYLRLYGGVANQQAVEFVDSSGSKWIIYKPGSTSELRFYNGGDLLTLGSSSATLSGNLICSGNIGVGTTNPSYKLDVSGNINMKNATDSLFYMTCGISSANTFIFNSSSTTRISDINVAADGSMTYRQKNDGSYPTRLKIDVSGNVGIGTTSPSCSLDVVGGIRARGGAPGAGGVNNNGYAFNGSGDTDSGMFCSANDLLEFYTASAERMRISAIGNLGIGTTNPSYKLDVAGDINTSGSFKYNGTAIGRTVAIGAIAWSGSSWYVSSAYQSWGISSITSNSSTSFYIVLSNNYNTPYPVPFVTVFAGATFPVPRVNGFYNGGSTGNYYSIMLSSTPFAGDGVFFEARL